jgi:hypothetical protein
MGEWEMRRSYKDKRQKEKDKMEKEELIKHPATSNQQP